MRSIDRAARCDGVGTKRRLMFETLCVPAVKVATLTELLHSKQIKDKVRGGSMLAWKDGTTQLYRSRLFEIKAKTIWLTIGDQHVVCLFFSSQPKPRLFLLTADQSPALLLLLLGILGFCGDSCVRPPRRRRAHCGLLQVSPQIRLQGSDAGKHGSCLSFHSQLRLIVGFLYAE